MTMPSVAPISSSLLSAGTSTASPEDASVLRGLT